MNGENYYNENDPKAAAWLRCLIEQGLIPNGYLDERSIEEIEVCDVSGYIQCHFFAGIGGWPEALRLAGWPNDVPVWTGSCPCQSLSSAGKRTGEMDERHLWPAFCRLIAQCRPTTVFGEQVASSDGFEWLDGISLDLEELGYAVGAADLPAACVGAPHSRQRIYWMADYKHDGPLTFEQPGIQETKGRVLEARRSCNAVDRMGITIGNIMGRDGGTTFRTETEGDSGGQGDGTCCFMPGSTSENDYWGRFAIARFTDGTSRRFEPGTFPLANGVPARMGRLRGYGNAIVPQVAAKFIRAYIESCSENEQR